MGDDRENLDDAAALYLLGTLVKHGLLERASGRSGLQLAQIQLELVRLEELHGLDLSVVQHRAIELVGDFDPRAGVDAYAEHRLGKALDRLRWRM